jgi:hypothetical protein
MSLVARYLDQASARTAEEANRRLGIDAWSASKLAPVAVSLIMYALRREAGNVVGATALMIALNCYTEDLLEDDGRLGDADVLFRGETILERHFSINRHRATTAISDLAMIGYDEAQIFLAVAAAAVVSALAKARRELKLDVFQLQGVVKSEAAAFDRVDAMLFADLKEWVFRPSMGGRVWQEIWVSISRGVKSARASRIRRAPQLMPAE